MAFISREELLELARPTDGPRVSVYLPLDRRYPEARSNPARLRAALETAERRLREYAAPLPEDASLCHLLAPANGLLKQEEFWRGCRAESLGVLLGRDFSRIDQLPFPCEESVDVGSDFRLAPLVRLASWPAEYFVLALSSNAARLFHGTASGLAPMELPTGVARSMEAFSTSIEQGPPARYQSGIGGSWHGGTPAVAHGGTSYTDDAELRRREYIAAVASAVEEMVGRTPDVPLVLASAQELQPIFKAAYRGSNLYEPGLHGSPDHIPEAELRENTARLIESHPSGAFGRAYQQFHTAPRTASTIKGVLPAAIEGRVRTIFLAFGERIWGHWDKNMQTVEIAPGSAELHKCQDLGEIALAQTLLHGGDAYVVERQFTPGDSAVAAILRW